MMVTGTQTMKYEKLEAGKTYYEHKTEKAGNTTMTRLAIRPVLIVELHPEQRAATVRWNGNAPTKWYESKLKTLKLTDEAPKRRSSP